MPIYFNMLEIRQSAVHESTERGTYLVQPIYQISQICGVHIFQTVPCSIYFMSTCHICILCRYHTAEKPEKWAKKWSMVGASKAEPIYLLKQGYIQTLKRRYWESLASIAGSKLRKIWTFLSLLPGCWSQTLSVSTFRCLYVSLFLKDRLVQLYNDVGLTYSSHI